MQTFDKIIQLQTGSTCNFLTYKVFVHFSAIDLVNEAYSTEKCHCIIKDVACLGW